ncbi:choline monooxygenase, chloroplastic [Tanacetum coccineum]
MLGSFLYTQVKHLEGNSLSDCSLSDLGMLKVFENVSIQRCDGGELQHQEEFDRLGAKYGPWMDTNLVLPLGPQKCKVVFDYFLDASLKDDEDFVAKSLEASERVQMEDIMLCESVQRGLESPAYDSGRYAPIVEKAMHHFHCLLHEDLIK